MKVKDMLEALKKADPDLDVVCYTEDEELLPESHIFRILEIDGIDITEGEKYRGEDGIASLKLGKSDYSKKHVSINITCTF